ncbi:hypothetical protein PV325_010276, partial [Microctonus aethiopoides]
MEMDLNIKSCEYHRYCYLSNLDATVRKINSTQFQKQNIRVLVAADVAVPGIDIPHLDNPPQDNPKIPGPSGAIEFKYSDKFGRHVVATRDIDAQQSSIWNFLMKIADPILKFVTNNRFDHTKYESVYSLWRQNTIEFKTAMRLSVILHLLAATTNIFGGKISDSKLLLNNGKATFIGRLILVNFEIALMNAAK